MMMIGFRQRLAPAANAVGILGTARQGGVQDRNNPFYTGRADSVFAAPEREIALYM